MRTTTILGIANPRRIMLSTFLEDTPYQAYSTLGCGLRLFKRILRT
ncbi:hypothetical protein H5410_015348 [Solanum commersonii]|uniref:Uncharacterized protein n=1 Tax=Solanum commersonii TaxID=4109 RepID=A0A9J5ZU52_SOLCO|nr:hypothetical protein H5410_015348 [Solanum commersonii]